MSDYMDNNGYFRGNKKHSDLIHRQIAYEEIYLKNREKYPLPFSEYVIHHKDRKKLNNSLSNLDIVTPEEHKQIHTFGLKDKEELDHRKRIKSYENVIFNIMVVFFISFILVVIIYFTFISIKNSKIEEVAFGGFDMSSVNLSSKPNTLMTEELYNFCMNSCVTSTKPPFHYTQTLYDSYPYLSFILCVCQNEEMNNFDLFFDLITKKQISKEEANFRSEYYKKMNYQNT